MTDLKPPILSGSPEIEPGSTSVTPLGDVISKYFADLQTQYTVSIDYVQEARMTVEERHKIMHDRRENTDDSSVMLGQRLGDKLAQRSGAEDPVELTEEEAQLLDITGDPPFTTNRRYSFARMSTLLTRFGEQGPDSIFSTAQVQDAQEGRRRKDGENTMVAVQSALLQVAQYEVQTHQFASAIGLVRAALPPEEAPQWFVNGILETVGGINFETDRAGLEALATVADHIPAPKEAAQEGILKAELHTLSSWQRIWRKSHEAKVRFEEVRREEQGGQKRTKHETRLATLAEDTYTAAISAGRSEAERSFVDTTTSPFTSVAIQIEGRDETYTIPFSVMAENPMYKRMLDRISAGNDPSAVTQLNRLLLLSEDQELFDSVAQTLADRVQMDWTGYTRSDYTNPDDWQSYWRESLRRMVDGYAIGVIEGAVAYEQPIAEVTVTSSERITRSRRDMARSAYGLLLGEKNFLKSGTSVDFFQVDALKQLGEFRSSLGDGEAGKRFDGFFAGDKAIILEAIEEVKFRKTSRAREKADLQIALEEKRQELNKTSIAIAEGLASVLEIRDGSLAEVRMFMSALQEFQKAQKPIKDWIVVAGTKKDPVLQVPQETKSRLMTEESKLKAELELLKKEDRGIKEDKEAQMKVRRQLQSIAVQNQFVTRLEVSLQHINSSVIGGETKMMGLQTVKGRFQEIYFSRPAYGQMSQKEMEDYDTRYNQLFGPGGQYEKLTQEAEELQKRQQTLVSSDDIAEFKKLEADMKRFGVDRVDKFKEDVTNHQKYYNATTGMNTAAEHFLYDVVLPDLRTKGLVGSRFQQ